jgi:hypothetical protein
MCATIGRERGSVKQRKAQLDPYYGMGEEHYTVLVCSGFKKPLAEVWPRFRVWN